MFALDVEEQVTLRECVVVYPLDPHVLAVAKFDLEHGQWAAYVGPVTRAHDQSDDARMCVLRSGTKVPRDVAELLFVGALAKAEKLTGRTMIWRV